MVQRWIALNDETKQSVKYSVSHDFLFYTLDYLI